MSTNQSAFDFDRKPLPDITRRKHHGNERSEDANARLDCWKPSARQTIVELIAAKGAVGMTSEELEMALGKAKNKFSGRLSELKLAQVLYVRGTRNGCDVLVHKQFA